MRAVEWYMARLQVGGIDCALRVAPIQACAGCKAALHHNYWVRRDSGERAMIRSTKGESQRESSRYERVFIVFCIPPSPPSWRTATPSSHPPPRFVYVKASYLPLSTPRPSSKVLGRQIESVECWIGSKTDYGGSAKPCGRRRR